MKFARHLLQLTSPLAPLSQSSHCCHVRSLRELQWAGAACFLRVCHACVTSGCGISNSLSPTSPLRNDANCSSNPSRISVASSPIALISRTQLRPILPLAFSTSFPKELEARYHAAKAAGRGVIFVTPHLGNWEMLAFAMSAIVEPIAYLARPLDNPLLDRYTSRVRSRFGNLSPLTSATQSWKVSPFSTPAATSAFLPM